jgi:hypothetical protein
MHPEQLLAPAPRPIDRAPPVPGSALRAAETALRDRGWAVLRDLPFLVDGRPDPAAALAIAAALGVPSDRDGGVPVWPVAPAPLGGGTTFSSRAGRAGLHTDAQYHRVPEDLVCMFVVRAAASGGLTRVLAAADAVAAIGRQPGGSRLLGLLARPDWRWRVPAEFTADRARPQDSPPAPVLAGDGALRWRGDNLAARLPAALRAVAPLVDTVLDRAPEVVTLDLRAGDLIVVDNRRVLHGRTWFDDSRRLLLRVRLWRRP